MGALSSLALRQARGDGGMGNPIVDDESGRPQLRLGFWSWTALGCVSGVARCTSGASCLPSGECGPCNLEQCNIDGSCFESQHNNPLNPCERCDPDASRRAWSSLADGARCDDGEACTESDICIAGACTGSAASCDDGVFCNGVEACVEDDGACSTARGTSPCAVGCIESERLCAGTVGQCIGRDLGARFCSDRSIFACDDDHVADLVEPCTSQCQAENGAARCVPEDDSGESARAGRDG